MKSTILICSTIFSVTALAHPNHTSELYTFIHPETMILLLAFIPLAIFSSRNSIRRIKWCKKTAQRIKSD